jgi:gliding motility-associated-like protein
VTPSLSSYQWSTGDTTQSINVQPSTTNAYWVIGTDANGCQNTDTVVVTVNQLPVVDATAADTLLCLHASTTLSVTPSLSSYLWSTGDTTQSINVQPSTTNAYWVIGTDANGCQNTDSVVVTVNQLPVVDATAADTLLCLHASTTLSVTPSLSSYLWSTGDTTSAISVQPSVTTAYWVMGTDANGCSDTATVTVTVNPLPIVDVGPDQDLCLHASTTLSVTAGLASILWSTGDTTQSINVQPSVTTLYWVTGTDANGCTNSDTIIVNVHPLPIVDAGQDQSICEGDNITLTATGAATYLWNTGETTSAISVQPSAISSYWVIGTDVNGCDDTDTVTISVFSLPAVSAIPSTICAGDQALLTASGALTYTWQPGNITGDSVIVTPNLTTTYTVTGMDANGCEASSSVTVTVRTDCPLPVPQISIPTAFTPNADGLNDIFRIEESQNFTLTSLRIFNRWGEEVFITTDITQGWDGHYKGQRQPIGGYAFLVLGVDAAQKPVAVKGSVTLIR